MISHPKKNLYKFLYYVKSIVLGPHGVFNLNFKSSKQKKVLICYLPLPFEKKKIKHFHSNELEVIKIVDSFIELDYIVDIVPCYTPALKRYYSKGPYDIIFGFGPNFEEACASNLKAQKIAYLTESSPKFSQRQELERIDFFKEKYSKKDFIIRSGKYLSEKTLELSNSAILLGNQVTLKSYSEYKIPIFTLRPTGILNTQYYYSKLNRDFSKTKKCFLWFGSDGVIHKGLDLLIEVFNQRPDLELLIAGVNARESWIFDLINGDNIKNIGFINVNSKEFLNLIEKTSFSILPSCSEGMSTSIITTMKHSLIPIITRECGVDIEGCGFYIDSLSTEGINATLNKALVLSESDIQNIHQRVDIYMSDKFNLDYFKEDFKTIIKGVLSKQ